MGSVPGSARPGWSVGLLSAEFSKLRRILVLALHEPKSEQKPFPCRAAALSCPRRGETDVGPSPLTAWGGREGGREAAPHQILITC